MRMTYINVRQIEGEKVFEACHALDLNMAFMDDSVVLYYMRTTIKDLNTAVDNSVYQYKNSKGMALKQDEPAQNQEEPGS